jgi:microcystin-dependent protein
MANGKQIPVSAPNVVTGKQDFVSAGGGAAGRIGSIASSQTVGGNSGAFQVTLSKTNLPDHTHTLKGDKGTQYYAVRSIAGDPQDGDATAGLGPASQATKQMQYLSNSGPIALDSGTTTGNPLTIMNPYVTINYIIFTGVYL